MISRIVGAGLIGLSTELTYEHEHQSVAVFCLIVGIHYLARSR